MPRQSKLVTYTSEELRRMPSQTDWDAVRAMTDEDIDAAIANDPDAGELDASRLAAATFQTPIRFEWAVWQWLLAQQSDVHTLVNAALRAWIETQHTSAPDTSPREPPPVSFPGGSITRAKYGSFRKSTIAPTSGVVRRRKRTKKSGEVPRS